MWTWSEPSADAQEIAEAKRLERLQERRQRLEATQAALLEARSNPSARRAHVVMPMQASARDQESEREAFRHADARAEARESAKMIADAARLDAQEWAREAQRKQAIRDVGRANLDAITAKREASRLAKQRELEEEVSVEPTLPAPDRMGPPRDATPRHT